MVSSTMTIVTGDNVVIKLRGMGNLGIPYSVLEDPVDENQTLDGSRFYSALFYYVESVSDSAYHELMLTSFIFREVRVENFDRNGLGPFDVTLQGWELKMKVVD